MRALVDTQALLWWLADDPQLGPKARRIFQSEEPVISPVLLWEIAIKVRLGKLEADVAEIAQALPSAGFERIGFLDSHMIALAGLPLHHRDPFDRMLIVQAINDGVPLLSSDAKFRMYDVELLDARG